MNFALPLSRTAPICRRDVSRFERAKALAATLAYAGTLALALLAWPHATCAQSAGSILPKGTVPVLKGVVSGSAVVSAPIPNATGNTLTITQLDPSVIIDWNSFNIASGSTVQFIQPSSSAEALNRIYSNNPSIIQGSLTANGQIFLINQNGILFDRGTQINVNTLYASTLNITNAQFANGVVPANATTPSFAGGYDANGNSTSTATGAIEVGAYGSPNAQAPRLTSASGGAIVLLAPMINNQSGIISSPDGQVILAAGNSAYLQFPAASDISLRGLVVEIDAATGPVNLTSLITNMGTLQANRGNVTLAALAINQGGMISATTALQKNGTIYLQAGNVDNSLAGTITLLPGSVIQTPLDTTDTSTLPESQSYDNYRAQVSLSAATIIDSGSIVSPSGLVSMTAASNSAGTVTPRIYLAPTSVIDVSGDNTTASLSQDLLTFKVTSNELANSPDQKGGLLEGATVTVDLNAGSTLLDLSAYQGAVEQNLAEKATSAGSVVLSSTGSVIQRLGSVISANGGTIAYSGGKDPVTELLGSDNKIYSITNAPEALTYTALLGDFTVSHPHWGQTETYDNTLMGLAAYVAPSVSGASGGSVTILPASGLVLDGTITASAIAGTRQLSDAPSAGSLTIGNYDPSVAVQSFGVKNIVFAAGEADTLGSAFTASTPLTQAQIDTTRLSSDLFASSTSSADGVFHLNGFENVAIGADQNIALPAGVALAAAPGGSFALRAQQIDIAGSIKVAAGAIDLDSMTTTAPFAAGGKYAVDVSGTLDASGQWSNAIGSGLGQLPLPSAIAATGSSAAVSLVNGGSIGIAAPAGVTTDASDVLIGKGALIDVSAGGSISATGKLSGGNGGAISIASANSSSGFDRTLELDGTLLGFGFSSGASLAIYASNIIIGTPLAPAASGTNTLAPGFFTSGGFSSYAISATNGVTVEPGTLINPIQQNYVLSEQSAAAVPSGASIAGVAQIETLPGYSRAPVSLALAAPLGAVTVGAGAVITLDPKASASITGGLGGVEMDGTIIAPGGNVSLTAANSAPNAALHLSPTADIDVSGTFVNGAPSLLGITTGAVIAGGTVSLTASYADLAADAGSRISVNGASQMVGSTQLSTQDPLLATAYSTNAGNVLITANDQFSFNSTLSGHASGDSAGGTFSLSYTNRNDFIDSSTGRRIVVTDAQGAALANPAYTDADVALNPLLAGGFDKIALSAEDVIQFDGTNVKLNFARGVTLNSQQFVVANGTDVSVKGAEVMLSNTFGQRIENDSNSGTILDNTQPSLPIATYQGSGNFTVAAATLDLLGSLTLNGVGEATLSSSGDTRLTGRVVGLPTSVAGAELIGSLTTAGNLTLQSSQLYPTTRTLFTIGVADGLTGDVVPGGMIRFEGSGTAQGEVLSAGGSLSVNADTIVQGGTVKAPLGTLDLNGATQLTLLPGSTTSTSGKGAIVPYGGTSAGVSWLYASTNDEPIYNALTAPPVKSMSLTGQSVTIEKGATVDITGGGDILGIEFVPGSGGGTDVLASNNTYAIIPSALLSSAPVDTAIATIQNLGYSSPTNVYNEIHIATGGVVPAGDYVLLPGYYALVPGAYIVQVQSGSKYSQLTPGQSISLANGENIVPAWQEASGTSVRSSQTIGVVIMPGSDANRLADYNQFNSSFFTQVAQNDGAALPVVPNDAGQLTLAATRALTINGSLLTTPGSATGNTAEIDISGKYLAVVAGPGQADVASNYLQIDASSLSSIDGSILLGGSRTSSATGVTVTPDASSILIANSAATPLMAPELLLASTGSITLLPGSVLSGAGTQIASARDITIDATGAATGAFIRASNSAPVSVTRSAAPDASNGVVTIDAGATIGASGSLLIDTTDTTVSNGRFALAPNAALSLVSSSINLGSVPANASGLSLDQAQLASLDSLGALVLKSYGSIDIYGSDVALGGASLQSLTLDSDALIGHSSATSPASLTASADSVTFENSSGASFGGSSILSGGALTVDANSIVIGTGAKSISGFSSVTLNAQTIVNAGVGQLDVGAPLTLAANLITGTSGANQSLVAADLSGAAAPANFYDVTLLAAPTSSQPASATGLGAKISIEGADIVTQTSQGQPALAIVANAGSVTLSAEGGGSGPGIVLGSGVSIDTSGKTQSFDGTQVAASAGSVSLFSDHGSIAIDAGSTINVSGAAQGGGAGSIAITSPAVAIAGSLLGSANAGQTQGSFSLDTNTLANFTALNDLLYAGGFTQSFDLRLRSQGLDIAPGVVVTANNVSFSADGGAITLEGSCPACSSPLAGAIINASSAQGGGSVTLAAQGNIALLAGSEILASGASTNTDPASPFINGGKVALSTTSGTVNFAPGAVIDVSAGATGMPGNVSITAPRIGNDSVAVTLQGTVLSKSYGNSSQAEVDVYGNQTYTVGTVLTASNVTTIENDNVAFMNGVGAQAIGAGLLADGAQPFGLVHVRPGVEIVSSGNLTIDQADSGSLNLTDPSAWILTNSASATPESGTLTIRAAGTLTLSDVSIGLPDNQLYAGNTWNINLVGGADLGAANVMQTQSASALQGTGSVILDGPLARVTSGSGNINIAAGYNFVIDNPTGVVYTSGVPVAGVTDTYQRWSTGGGNITITAQNDAIGSSGEFVTDWLRRTASGVPGDFGSWWSNRGDFEEGVAAFGGGNITIAAGDDVNNLSAAIPTSGRVYSPNPYYVQHGRLKSIGPGPFYLDVEGGGDLSVTAGNDIVGGQYLVGLGSGTIKAGGSVGADGVATQLYLMGENNVAARQVATIDVAAGGSVNLQSINDPTLVAQTMGVGPDPSVSPANFTALNFLTYSKDSAVSVQAKGGDITVYGTPAPEVPLNPNDASNGTFFGDNSTSVYWPATVSLVAFNGSVTSRIGQVYTTYPSSTGSIAVLAAGNIDSINLVQSAAGAPGSGPNAISSWMYPINTAAIPSSSTSGQLVSFSSGAPFVDDIVASNGSVTNSTFQFPAVSRIYAGDNLDQISVNLQNTQASDVSEIIANDGFFHPAMAGTSISGPGQLLIQAGGSIDLGTGSAGVPAVEATGDLNNASLPTAQSARITMIAGVTGAINLSDLDTAFAQLQIAGTDKNTAAAATAVAALFANDKINPGNIDTYQTSVQTEQGSGIDLLAPDGSITVGLTTPPSSTTTIGIVTNQGGAIRSYLSGDFSINQGKVLTALGGDIEIYTKDGNIDAGRGAKTSLTVPAPQRQAILSSTGATIGYVYVVSSAAAGSGIQTLTSDTGANGGKPPPAGSIYLFAPAGTVNAGEAGIVSGGDIVIEAQQVLNASNISAAGSTTGVPLAISGSLASSLVASGATTSSGTDKAADDAARAASAAAAANADTFAASILTVEVLGFGANQCKETDKQCLGESR